jgi:hypothetical protein
MGYILLWIENLTVSLLLIATVIACTSRMRRRWLGVIISTVVSIFVFLPYLLLSIWVGFAKFHDSFDVGFYPLMALAIFYLGGTIWLFIAGLFSRNRELDAYRAANWSRGKLALAFGISVALHLMTFWNIDMEARQQASLLRAEVSALAMSAVPPRISDEENAALLYDQADQSLGALLKISTANGQNPQGELWTKWANSMNKADFNPNDAELTVFFKRHSGTIALLLEAAKKPRCYVEHDYYNPSFFILLPELNSIRELARLLAIDALVKAANGDLSGAMQNIDGMFAMSKHNSAAPFLVSALVSCAIDNMAIDTLQSIINNHSLKTEDLDKINISGTFSYFRLMQRSMRYEDALRLNWLADTACKTDGNYWSINSRVLPIARILFNTFLLDNEIKVHRWYSQQINSLLDKPYYETKEEWKKIFNHPKNAPRALFIDLTMAALDRGAVGMARGDAQRRIVELVLAACRYRVKNGKYPEILDDLAPDFIAFVPLDPFDGKLLRFKQTDGKIIIYSIGPDEIDDGGAPYDQETRKGDIIFTLPK